MCAKIKFAALLVLLAMMLSSVVALASDVSDAEYKGQIAVTNNGTATTDVSANFSLNTQSLIDTGKINATATDAAIQTADGADVSFMPGYNGNPWVTWVPSIGEDETLYQYLYTGGVTGGELRYFPDTGGMTAADNETLELGDNSTIEQKGWVQTTFSDNYSNRNLLYKQATFRIYVSGTGNITSGITNEWGNSSDWISPTSATGGSAPANVYDENTGTSSQLNPSYSASPSGYISMPVSPAVFSKCVRIWHTRENSYINRMQVDVYYDGSWDNIYDADPGSGGSWKEITISSDPHYISEARVRYWCSVDPSRWVNTHEFDFNEAEVTGELSVTATGISSGVRKVVTIADTANLTILVYDANDVLIDSDSTALTANVTDNNAIWTYYENMGGYWEYTKIWVDGVLKQHIVWEYDTTFHDLSGNNHDATPTFRTSSSDPNVSAELVSFKGNQPTTPPSPTGQGGWDILPEVPDAPEGLFTELNMSFWGANYIVTFCEAVPDIPLALAVFFYAFGTAILLGMLAWYISSGGGKKPHGRGSLLAMAGTNLVVMTYFVYGGGGVIPAWVLIPFGLEALAFIVWRQTPSPY